ncbi:hypothetical protein MA13_contig00007-0140 [Edwardsiella piscicida]|uniref:Uncharacterized protein n=1 Tax=Edwardsiella anguillarum ET080813 TaxID=667120 RepID=A0A076LUD8_9GAMM|nr:Hypothetical protein ETEE_2756 [Edwardsiella anguillarum ET080813]GAJ67832.1 hypothetical protein MA13_contig00007-0140 [Edwardsiella piscicida]
MRGKDSPGADDAQGERRPGARANHRAPPAQAGGTAHLSPILE